ncbi:MAG: CoA transferase [Dehalococcoidia bacterium]|nr:CoA transferase [Dehalococcoidia bacterium]
MLPLEGVRVLDMTIWQQGPVATMMLGDLGAEVIKIEEPRSGDPGRYLRSATTGTDYPLCVYFEANNRNKKSLAINLRLAPGREALYRLVAGADVFVSNYRTTTLQQMGLDYPSLRALNPRLVYAQATGFGLAGPDKDRPAFDIAAQARGGMLSISGHGPPGPIGAGMADQYGATCLAYGLMVALYMRERTGEGQFLECSLLGCQAFLGNIPLQSYLFTKTIVPKRDRAAVLNPLWNVYGTQDARWFMLAMVRSDPYWHAFCETVGLQSLEREPRFKDHAAREGSSPELIAILDQLFATRTAQEWSRLFRERDLVWEVVRTYDEVAADPQLRDNGHIQGFDHPVVGPTEYVGQPVHWEKGEATVRSSAPELGQHTEEVLVGLAGYTWEEIEGLRAAGVIP